MKGPNRQTSVPLEVHCLRFLQVYKLNKRSRHEFIGLQIMDFLYGSLKPFKKINTKKLPAIFSILANPISNSLLNYDEKNIFFVARHPYRFFLFCPGKG